MTGYDTSKRRFLQATGSVLAVGVLAGCLGGDDDNGGNGNGDDNGGNGNGDDNGGTDDEYDFGDWFDNVDNYDGVEDHTGEDEVTVMNGTGPSGYQYDPPAIVVDPGTTVVWEWTGDGGGHTVTEDDGEFDSGMLSDAGETFEHTFDDEGTYRYYCEPHVNMGQKGVVVVE
ncbi:halocyanin domain-containing protein [Natronosalvus vescus]|uniref:halocyanin domain-containing protein n=1 Tax=Natronosalvus vescus TaxID=2953881 RepID=UPI002090799F|nr:halocyanin domain-containing protein [Natronosalvus vescus]